MRFLDFDSMGKGKQAVKPALGDTVLYENQKYIVTEVGLKYLHVKHATTGAPGLVKIMEVVKWVEPVESRPSDGLLNPVSEVDLDKEFGTFGNAN